MHRYYHSVLPNWNPAWMLIPLAVWAILLSVALSLPVAYSEPGVRHALPDPYIPECYAVEWRSGQYCEFRPVNRHYRN